MNVVIILKNPTSPHLTKLSEITHNVNFNILPKQLELSDFQTYSNLSLKLEHEE